MIELALKFWCRHFHKNVMRPVRGKYTCATCLRSWPVPWEHPDASSAAQSREVDVVITPPDPWGMARSR